jgi:hypothetical protein
MFRQIGADRRCGGIANDLLRGVRALLLGLRFLVVGGPAV